MEEKDRKNLLHRNTISLVQEEIDEETAERFEELIVLSAKQKFQEIAIEICCRGGDFEAAQHMANLILGYDGQVTGKVIGVAYSSAADILQACHHREAFSTSELSFHNFHGASLQDGSKKHLKAAKTKLLEDETVCHRRTAAKSKMSLAKVDRLYRADFFLYAPQALTLGLVDKLISWPTSEKRLAIREMPTKRKSNHFLISDIGSNEVVELAQRLERLSLGNCPPLLIDIETQDNEHANAMEMFQLLRFYPGKIQTRGYGHLSSSATIILQAGDDRRLQRFAKVNLENFQGTCNFLQLNDPWLEKVTRRQISQMGRVMKNILAERWLGSARRWRNSFSGNNINATDAIKLGLADAHV